MPNNFAEYINRIGTDSVKWDSFEERYPGLDSKDCIPMWVADTDFKAPQEVIDAIVVSVTKNIIDPNASSVKIIK